MKTSKTGSSIWKPSLILVILLASVIAYAGISQSQGGSGGQMSLTDGLVLHWTFDGAHMDWSNTGAEVRDISGSGNHGSLEGTLGQGSVARGIMGQALDFSASNSDRIQTSANNDDLVGQDITITAWIKPRSTSVRQQIVTQDGESYDCRRFFFEVNASNQVAFGVYTANDSSGNPVLGTVVADRWQFVAARLTDGSEKKIWLDDDSTTSTTGSLTIQYHGNTDPIQVSGRLRNGGENFFDGLIDDVRIYTRALSDDEIQQIKRVGERTLAANSPANALTDGLVAHWTFDGPDMDWGNTGQEVRDLSGNNNHGSLEGSLGQSSVARGNVGQALYFNGTSDYVNIGDVETLRFGTGDFTFATWVKTEQDCTGNKVHLGKYHNISNSVSVWLGCTDDGGDGKASFSIRDSDGGDSLRSGVSTTVVNDGGWYFITGVKEGNTVKIYVNGTLENSGSRVLTGNVNAGDVYIGAYNDLGHHSDATLDDVRIYNRALSGAEIQQLFELGKKRITPNTSATGALTDGLVAHWTFDGADIEWGERRRGGS